MRTNPERCFASDVKRPPKFYGHVMKLTGPNFFSVDIGSVTVNCWRSEWDWYANAEGIPHVHRFVTEGYRGSPFAALNELRNMVRKLNRALGKLRKK